MTSYRWKTRSSTPGEFGFVFGTMSQFTELSDIRLGAYRGDGGAGTLSINTGGYATMATKQKYVCGSYVPGFFWGVDFYPNSQAPDDTDLSAISGLKHVQFKLTTRGEPITVEATKSTKTIDGVAHTGMLVSAADMVATLDTPSRQWFWRFELDLTGDGNPCYSDWQPFAVYGDTTTTSSS